MGCGTRCLCKRPPIPSIASTARRSARGVRTEYNQMRCPSPLTQYWSHNKPRQQKVSPPSHSSRRSSRPAEGLYAASYLASKLSDSEYFRRAPFASKPDYTHLQSHQQPIRAARPRRLALSTTTDTSRPKSPPRSPQTPPILPQSNVY